MAWTLALALLASVVAGDYVGSASQTGSLSQAEEVLANTVVNEISTQEWSKKAKKLAAPSSSSVVAPAVETWYINADSATDRADCMEQQLTEAGMAPLKFSALETASEDCVAHGIEDMPELSVAEKARAVSSWCNHKKLFEALSAAPSSAEYFLVLEDTAVISTNSIKKVLDDFLVHTDKQFSLLQLDPYGGVAQPTAFHRGRPLYQPSADLENSHAYRGSHALLVKRTALVEIVQLMNRRKASKVEDVVAQLPSALSMSGGVALNPMINKFQERLALPAYCKATTTHPRSSFLESQAQSAESDIWSLWERAGEKKSLDNTAWWVPNAKSWFSLTQSEEKLNVTEPSSSLLDVFQMGAHDEDPGRAVCFRDALQARGLGTSKRIQLLQIPADCTSEVDATEYHACLARNGFEDCTVAGKLSIDDFENVDWSRRLQIRDHVTKATCAFQRALKQVREGSSPYVLLLNENAVLGKDVKKQITSFIEAHPEDVKGKAWKALQIDPYGREAPIDQGLGGAWSQEKKGDDEAKIADFKYLDDEQAKSRFWGMHAVLLKREAIPTILAEMKMDDGTAIGAVDRVPRHTEGWLAANLGVAYDPHMAMLTKLDECQPSRAEHFNVARSEIPEAWTVQKDA